MAWSEHAARSARNDAHVNLRTPTIIIKFWDIFCKRKGYIIKVSRCVVKRCWLD